MRYLLLIILVSFCSGCEEDTERITHPNAAVEYAQNLSGLSLPTDIKLAEDRELVYDETTGSKEYMSMYEIDSNKMQSITLQCIEKNFSRLPMQYRPMKYYNPNNTDSGYYQLIYAADSTSIKLVVLNTVHNQLMVVIDSL